MVCLQDDTKVVLAKAEVMTLLETIQKQQQQFADLPEQLHLNPNVPITFTKDNRAHIGPKMEMRVVTLGLDNAGKTSILFQLKQNESITTIPTIGACNCLSQLDKQCCFFVHVMTSIRTVRTIPVIRIVSRTL